jgi:hypothetical protein
LAAATRTVAFRAVAHRQRADHHRQCTGGSNQMPDHRLGRAGRNPVGRVAERAADRPGLGGVVGARAGAVGADVVELFGAGVGSLQRQLDRARGVRPRGLGRADVESV